MELKIERLLLQLLLLLVASTRLNAAELVYPGLEWERDTNGLSPESVRSVDVFVHTLDTTGLMVVQHGRVIYEFITHEGDALVVQEPGRFPGEIFPESETVFFNNMENSQLTFKKNSQGEVTAIIHHETGQPDSEGKKIKSE
jgi:hypothetical protein